MLPVRRPVAVGERERAAAVLAVRRPVVVGERERAAAVLAVRQPGAAGAVGARPSAQAANSDHAPAVATRSAPSGGAGADGSPV